MVEINVPINCPKCGKETLAGIKADPRIFAPKIRGDKMPDSVPYRYHVTSEDIKEFILKTARTYVPEVEMDIFTRYHEKKIRKGSNEPHRSYAFFKMAFSYHVIKDYNNGWFQQLGQAGNNVQICDSMMKGLIDRWKYDIKDINKILKSYENMEQLEDTFGITDEFIIDLKEFAVPKGVRVKGGKDIWVFFSASPEAILHDYFTDKTTNKVAGKLSIKQPTMISKDIIDYEVTLDPYIAESAINPHVRQILAKEEKY